MKLSSIKTREIPRVQSKHAKFHEWPDSRNFPDVKFSDIKVLNGKSATNIASLLIPSNYPVNGKRLHFAMWTLILLLECLIVPSSNNLFHANSSLFSFSDLFLHGILLIMT